VVLTLLLPALAPASDCERVENLETFAKVYGYARFFNPSDEATTADWEQLAIDGADQAMQVCGSDELAQLMRELFEPVAPGIVILPAGQPMPANDQTSTDEVVAWQHYGVGLGTYRGYLSIRTNRDNLYPPWGPIGVVTQVVLAEQLRGKEIRMQAAVRAEAPSTLGFPLGQGQLWLRVDRENGQSGFFDNMANRPVTDPEWGQYEIVGPVADDAVDIHFGAFLNGIGNLWLDAFELEARDPGGPWLPVPFNNPGFEESVDQLLGWGTSYPYYYSFSIDDSNPFAGARCAQVSRPGYPAPDRLFDALPALGETIVKDIGSGLQMSLPLALPVSNVKSLTSNPSLAASPLATPKSRPTNADFNPDFWSLSARYDSTSATAAEISTRKSQPGPDTATRLAAVVLAWNTLQHFYPYFDVVDVNWDAELKHAIQWTLKAESEWEFYMVMKRLFADLDDGHGHVYGPFQSQLAALPIRACWIEEQAVVTASLDPQIQVGDVIDGVDGVKTWKYLDEIEVYLPGSDQWRRYQSLANFNIGFRNTDVTLTLLREDGEHEVVSSRTLTATLPLPRPPQISTVAEGIYYVDLSRASMAEISAQINDIAAADGVIFDMRGYPNGNDDVLSYLVDVLSHSATFNIPQTIYPDRQDVTWYVTGWDIWPAQPRIQGKVVFMTDESAISYAESVMGTVEDNDLAEIVGRPTAGANGNANYLNMPGGYAAYWTGMKIVKQDGSQHHNIGIQPTVHVERTIAAIREGRDEDLEVAIALIQDPS
jgi:hypothetical protein